MSLCCSLCFETRAIFHKILFVLYFTEYFQYSIPYSIFLHPEAGRLSPGTALMRLRFPSHSSTQCNILLERITDRPRLVFQMWESGSHFIENEWSKPVSWRKRRNVWMMTKLNTSHNNWNFGKYLSMLWAAASLPLKIFLRRLVMRVTNRIFCYCVTKWVSL